MASGFPGGGQNNQRQNRAGVQARPRPDCCWRTGSPARGAEITGAACSRALQREHLRAAGRAGHALHRGGPQERLKAMLPLCTDAWCPAAPPRARAHNGAQAGGSTPSLILVLGRKESLRPARCEVETAAPRARAGSRRQRGRGARRLRGARPAAAACTPAVQANRVWCEPGGRLLAALLQSQKCAAAASCPAAWPPGLLCAVPPSNCTTRLDLRTSGAGRRARRST